MGGSASEVLGGALLARVAELAGASRSPHRVLETIVAAMAESGYPGVGITLINERDELYVVAYDGPPDEAILALRLPVGEGIMGTVAAQGSSMLVGDLDDPDGPAPANRTTGGHARMRNLLAVPITAGHTVIGVLEVDSTQPNRFGRADLALFERVAADIAGAVQAAVPIEMAGELLRRRVHEVVVLEDTTRALAETIDLEDVARAVVRSAARGLDSPYTALLRLDDGGATLLTDHGDAIAGGRETGGGPTRHAGLGSVPSATVMLVEGAIAEPHLRLASGSLGARAVALAGIEAGAEFHGVLAVASRDARGFDPAEARLIRGIADLAALAISNASRYRRLADAADTDATTGLLNRARFERELATARGTAFSTISIDIDRLKLINDSYGHEAGDAVLQRVAVTLRELTRERGCVARTGGDEFAVLLAGARISEAVAFAEEIRTAMYGLVVPFGVARVSIGVAAAEAGAGGRATWSAADAALDRAKRWGRDRVECADSDAAPHSHRPTRWDDAVVELIAARGLDSVYQAIVRLSDLTVVAHEALARPAGAAPDLSVEGLFAAAHRTGWSRELDWLARRAAVQGGHRLPAGTPLFINCSVGALLDPVHDVDQMALLLRWAGRSPGDVVLEITEREVVDDLARFQEVLAIYREHGFRFAIDDVGEGHSTLEVLARGEPEFIKIARSLTVSAHLLGPRSAIHAVVAFARSSGATIIAEGIEGEREADLISAMGIDHGQGWWLGRPTRMLGTSPALGGAQQQPLGATALPQGGSV